MKLPQKAGSHPCPPPGEPGATGVGTAFGTFGELLQGVLPEEDGDFLVTLPVARWTRAAFRLDPDLDDVVVRPVWKRKARRLARMIVEEGAPRPVGGELTVHSLIPEGKGLASSSADLVATARAVGQALGLAMPAPRIERFLARIEPTDGVLYPGIVAFHHRSVRLRAVLGSLPPWPWWASTRAARSTRWTSTASPSRSRRPTGTSTRACWTGSPAPYTPATWRRWAGSRPGAR
ncbi:hypothetical protein LUX02_19820 [Streptomyces somaliensis]|nr:hypothetical protein [Streptomyces somaliensis]